jgi:hypothetical protein
MFLLLFTLSRLSFRLKENQVRLAKTDAARPTEFTLPVVSGANPSSNKARTIEPSRISSWCFRRRGRIFPRMPRERYIARSIQHWHVVRIGADGKETVVEITDSEEAAKVEAARLDRDAERTYRAGGTSHS